MKLSYLLGVAIGLLAACGSATTTSSATDVGNDDTASADIASADIASDATTTTGPTWRDTLKVCWTDLSCKRAFVISHGGDWSIDDLPYDSQGAFHRAADKGADGIKTDVHVTKDNIAVVAHSSPIETWESTECAGQKIEEMTAAQVTACHLFPSEVETFQRLDDVLEWARGKVVIMLTVKEPVDFARAIAVVKEHKAEDYVFLETSIADLQNAVTPSAGWDTTWYNVQTDNVADVQQVVTAAWKPRVAFVEVNVKYQEAHSDAEMTDLLNAKIHPAGLRGFVSTIHLPTVADHVAMFDAGFDVIMTYNLDNALVARKQVNAARGVTPE